MTQRIYNRISSILIIILINFSLLFCGCIEDDSNNDNNNSNEVIEITYELSTQIQNASVSNYTIICPVFIDKNGNLSNINEEFNAEYNFNVYDINETIYGYGLFVNSNKSIEIKLNSIMKQEEYFNNFLYLSLYNESQDRIWRNKYFLYFDSDGLDNIKISINVKIKEINGYVHINIEKILNTGWTECEAIIDHAGS